jgi:hypothetical protein
MDEKEKEKTTFQCSTGLFPYKAQQPSSSCGHVVAWQAREKAIETKNSPILLLTTLLRQNQINQKQQFSLNENVTHNCTSLVTR